MEDLIKKITEKKELKSVDKEFALKILKQTINEHKKIYKELEQKNFNPKSKEFKEIIKHTRKKLRDYYGSYNTTITNLKKEELNTTDLLKKHLSTRERIADFEKVSEFIGNKKSILDLGCGYNPFFYNQLKSKPKYLASDISNDLEHIKKYFEQEKINGDILKLDLTDEDDLKKLNEISKDYEVTLLLKVLDPLEKQKKNISKKVFENINSKEIIVSFSTMSIGGRVPIKSKRTWFYKLIKDLKYEELELDLEKYIKIQK